MFTSVTDKISKTGSGYLIASAIIAIASYIYGMFSHGVYSPFMTFAFLIPLVPGAGPHIAGALCGRSGKGERLRRVLSDRAACDAQLAVIATLTTGSLLKGALDIYGTTNRLMMVYPVLAAAVVIAAITKTVIHRSADCSEQI